MRKRQRLVVAATMVLAIAALEAGARAQDKPDLGPIDASTTKTVDGPESEAVRAKTSGVLLLPEPVGGLVRVDLPGGEKKNVREPDQGHPAIRLHDGPDETGHVLIVMDEGDDSVLRLERLDGKPGREVARGQDGSGFKFTFSAVELAPTGGRAVVVREQRSIHMKVEPKTWFREGRGELWDAANGKKLDFEMTALSDSASWFPDGKSFCISALVSPAELPKGWIDDYNEQAHGKRGSVVPLTEARVPVVHRIELEGGKQTPLQIGRRSLVSSDGRSILVQGIGTDWMKRDVATGKFARVSIPGVFHGKTSVNEGGPIAFLAGDVVIYWGLPTTGSGIATTTNNSPLVGEKPMLTIKAATLSDGRFVTLLPAVDPRRRVAFGTPRP